VTRAALQGSVRRPVRLRASTNFNRRPAGQTINTLIIHYTGMMTAAAALDRLCDPTAEVSAHYLIDENGVAWQLVAEEQRAWHAGVSIWRGERDINGCSIGVELAHPGHEFGYRPFPARQIDSLVDLCQGLLTRHPITAARVLGHSDVAPGRKQDPGEAFPWRQLAEAGIGLWPDAASPLTLPLAQTQALLGQFGYSVVANGRASTTTSQVLSAFQSHFRPWRVTDQADGDTTARLASLVHQIS
jgi:N-acetylmuramoyl-L-alanine amidase